MKTSKKIVPHYDEFVKRLGTMSVIANRARAEMQTVHQTEQRKRVEKKSDVMQDFETIKRAYEDEPNGDNLNRLARLVANSTIKKLVNASGDSYVYKLRTHLQQDIHIIDTSAYSTDCAYVVEYDNNGECVTNTADADMAKASNRICGQTMSIDGVDLVQVACVAILEYRAQYGDYAQWLDLPITIRKLARKVYYQIDAERDYKDVETTPMREIYRAVRRYITEQQNHANNADYIYVDMDEDDTELSQYDRAYYRCGHYADMGGNDQYGITADNETVREYARLIAKLQLSPQQATIVKLRMRGLGYDAIAVELNVAKGSVQKQLVRIQKKCEEMGIKL